MKPADYYELLQVSPKADTEIIQAAYRRLCLRYHPDRAVGDADAERMMKLLNAAYEVLSDPERRRRYDAEIGAAKNSADHQPDDSPSKTATRQKSTEDVLNKARRQTQQMATFKITPPDLRRRVLSQSDPLCPFFGYRGNGDAVQTALGLAAKAFDAHVDIGLAAGKWHEPIWACSRDIRARLLLTGPPSVAARFAEDFAAVVSIDWDEQCRPIPFAMVDERPAKPTPHYVTWKLPWLALNGSTVKKPDDILSALERACRGKGLPLLPIRTEDGVRHYRLPPLCMVINDVEALPKALMNWLIKMADAQDGIVGLTVFDKIDWRPATIIVATSRPGVLNDVLLTRFSTRLDLCR